MLIVCVGLYHTIKIGLDSTIDARNRFATEQLSVFGACPASSDIETGPVELVKIVKLAGVEIIEEIPNLDAAIERAGL